MTRKLTSYTTPGSHNLHIPSHSEFHRYTSNRIVMGDFCTDYNSGFAVEEAASAIRWTIKNEKKRNTKSLLINK